jgi:exodeoxyribonuclease VII large subunit
VIVYPTLVQGKEAAPNIVQAIASAEKHGKADVLIIARGGGSLEDLWPFNEEIVAHAIYACTIPTISAVGHETDFTIADFVADYRAPTPSAAAEVATPDGAALIATLLQYQAQCIRAISHILYKHNQRLALLTKSLIHPGQQLDRYAQFCDDLQDRLYRAITQLLALRKARFGTLIRALDALSPLAILKRGYSISYTQDHTLIQSTEQVSIGDRISTQLAQGSIISEIISLDNAHD